MKEINLKFIGLGINDMYQADIIIYDIFGNVVKKCHTYNAHTKVCLKKNCYYKVVAIMKFSKLERFIYINNNDTYYFVFNHAYINNRQRVITFYLRDYFYNLPIERGNLYIGKTS